MLGDDFNSPIVYQDLANSTMRPMNMNFGMIPGGINYSMYPSTSYLGGTTMRQQPDRDLVNIMNKKDTQDRGTLKKVLIAMGVILTLGAIPPLRNSIKKSGSVFKYVKNLFAKKPKPAATAGAKSSSGSWFTNLFKKKSGTLSSGTKKGNWFTNLFKKKSKTPAAPSGSSSPGTTPPASGTTPPAP